MEKTNIIIIAAVAQNNIIGNNDEIPWFKDEELRKADMKHFRSLTLGHPIIIGRVTYESIIKHLGKPLPDRTNIVVSGRGDLEQREGVIVCKDIFGAIDRAQELDSVIFIGGGERIYKQAIYLPHVTRMEITQIKRSYEGNKHFPVIHENEWELVNREDHDRYAFISYARRKNQNS